jgi:hypothetical protein
MNKKIKLIPQIIVILMLFLMPSCEKEEDIQQKLDLLNGQGYYPMQIGSIIVSNGKEYYRFNSESGYDYMRFSDGKVYVIPYEGIAEKVLYDLTKDVGDTWILNYEGENLPNNESVTLISKTDTVRVGNYTFYNCYRFDLKVTVMDIMEETYITWLAPNIGPVKEGGIYGIGNLEEVKIDGIKINF